MPTISLPVLAYLWGSLSPSFLVARWAGGIDLRRYGSGNVGSSNVGEQLGSAWTIGVGFLDLVKGCVPVLLLRAGGFDEGSTLLAGLATVMGHNWSLYLRFTGGRGMATTIGVLLAWDARLALLLLGALVAGGSLRASASGALIGLVLLAPGAWVLGDVPELVAACALLALLIAVKRLEANRLPLPADSRQRRMVLLRRLWQDRDVPRDQPWQERRRIE